ncbi:MULTISPECIES: TetR/AcrR family transcriptional regulator [unclassified Pseudomonas]|uniref:TetR/AcrR family transcriptional regulator n=1 Tax=unclassified Pseudomonas TaxID=196821 RepID=UPI001C49C467|nr:MULTISPECIES: TetR/AcrR family transcriptional regulator [unclassified Pseudomonas]
MRREPRQQRTLAIIHKVEQATLALLKESGITLLNTNAIAERSGIDIKSLYRFFPNKEAIVYRLVQQWLEEIRSREKAIYESQLDLIETWNALDDMIDGLEQQFSGYGALWQAMDVIPALHGLEQEHEAIQLGNMVALLRTHGCRWPEKELTELARYLYRTWDVVKQGSIEQGEARGLMWRTHKKWQHRLLLSAVKTQDCAEFERELSV